MTSTHITDNARAVATAARLLGLRLPATTTDITRAFRLFAELTHPDRNPGNPEAAEEFRRIRFAADVLTASAAGRPLDPYQVSALCALPTPEPDPRVAHAYNQSAPSRSRIDILL